MILFEDINLYSSTLLNTIDTFVSIGSNVTVLNILITIIIVIIEIHHSLHEGELRRAPLLSKQSAESPLWNRSIFYEINDLHIPYHNSYNDQKNMFTRVHCSEYEQVLFSDVPDLLCNLIIATFFYDVHLEHGNTRERSQYNCGGLELTKY